MCSVEYWKVANFTCERSLNYKQTISKSTEKAYLDQTLWQANQRDTKNVNREALVEMTTNRKIWWYFHYSLLYISGGLLKWLLNITPGNYPRWQCDLSKVTGVVETHPIVHRVCCKDVEQVLLPVSKQTHAQTHLIKQPRFHWTDFSKSRPSFKQ